MVAFNLEKAQVPTLTPQHSFNEFPSHKIQKVHLVLI